jgi:branched-subunit amino acid aminotransferase/4-amino-4-deoxychorismate lyase
MFGQIITDERYMLLPVDDRTATRAHGVFDVVYLKNKKLSGLEQHVNRLVQSAESASIQPPFEVHQIKDIIVSVVEQVVDYHLRNDLEGVNRKVFEDSLAVRITISSGCGDFSVASLVLPILVRANSLSCILSSSNPTFQSELL